MQQRRTGGGLGLERAPHAEQVHAVLGALQFGEDAERLEQLARLERGHVGAVALPGLEHAEDHERAHALAQRSARDAESFAELALDRQPRTGDQLAAHDHLPDAVDHDVRSRSRRLAGGGWVCSWRQPRRAPRRDHRQFIRSFAEPVEANA